MSRTPSLRASSPFGGYREKYTRERHARGDATAGGGEEKGRRQEDKLRLFDFQQFKQKREEFTFVEKKIISWLNFLFYCTLHEIKASLILRLRVSILVVGHNLWR